MNKTYLIFLLLLLTLGVKAQQSPIGEVTDDDLTLLKYTGDTNANAVVLKEYGNAGINNDDVNNVRLEYYVRIKIFNSKGFDAANVTIPLYKGSNNREEFVKDISGFTSYKDENGKVIRTALDTKDVFKENKNKYWDLVKFTLPDLREGCVIEYKYILESPFLFNFRTWEFQSSIPKISSDFIANIPAVYNYNVTLRGTLPLTRNNAEMVMECFSYGAQLKANCSRMTYAMDSIPAFEEESYMTAASNFRSAIYFELSDYYDQNGMKHAITKSWDDIDKELKDLDAFGGQIRRKNIFTSKMAPLVAAENDELEKAKTVYKYLQKWFKWDNLNGIYSEGIRKAFDNRSGSIADINLSLVAAMNSVGIPAEAVLLSTRNNGLINKLYPTISDFNYVVAKVDIQDKSYLLDASDPYLPFGLLPVHCINDQGRVMNFDKASYWIDLKASQKASDTYSISLALEENGKIKGSVINYSLGYEAHSKRESIKKFNSFEEYVENMDENMPKIKILRSELNNLDSLESPLSEQYEIEVDAYDDLDQEKFSYNPFFMNRISENPFKLIERTYPVDWGAPNESRITLSLTFPETYELVSSPEQVRLALPANGGFYITNQTVEGHTVTFSQMLQFAKSIYNQAEYPYLKALFNKMVEVHKSDFVFRKKQ